MCSRAESESPKMNKLQVLALLCILATVQSDYCYQLVEYYNSNCTSQCRQVCFCENGAAVCDNTFPVSVHTKKGETFTLSVIAVNQAGMPINATISSSLKLTDGEIGSIKGDQQKRQIEDRCTELEFTVFSSNNKNALIEINAHQISPFCDEQNSTKREVNISFIPFTCPAGFIEEPSSRGVDYACVCDPNIVPYVRKCSVENNTIEFVETGFLLWIKYLYINETDSWFFVGSACPQDYCIKRPNTISLAGLVETDEQCAFNRTGVVCGGCAEGLSLVFGSSKCQECSNYFLFVIIPFAVAGIALVAFILLTNMTVATGTIHGIIFYANVVAISKPLFFPFEKPNFLTVFISWLNLDLGIETCFYNGMDSYGKLMLQIVFPMYLFLLIIIFMLLYNRSKTIAKIIGKLNPEVTLYTLILLSYSKLIRITIEALQFGILAYPDGNRIVWFYDGNVQYTTLSHIPRFALGIIIMIFAVLYVIILTCGHVFTRYSEYKLFRWTTHQYYIHFMNAHHAPLNDNHRYWVGLQLLLKLIFYMFFALTHYLNYNTSQSVGLSSAFFAFLMMFLKLLRGSYVNRYTNYLEFSIFLNLFVLSLVVANVGTMFSRDAHRVVAYISMSIIFVSFIALTIWHTFGKHLNKTYKNIRKRSSKRFSRKKESAPTAPSATANNLTSSCQSRLPDLDILSPIQPEDYEQTQRNSNSSKPESIPTVSSFIDISEL